MKKALMLSATLLLVGCTEADETTTTEKTENTVKKETINKEPNEKETEIWNKNPYEELNKKMPVIKDDSVEIMDWEDSPLAKDSTATPPPPGTKVTVRKGTDETSGGIYNSAGQPALKKSQFPIYDILESDSEHLQAIYKYVNAVNKRDRKAYQELTQDNKEIFGEWETFIFDEYPEFYINADDIELADDEVDNMKLYNIQLSWEKAPVRITTHYTEEYGWQIVSLY